MNVRLALALRASILGLATCAAPEPALAQGVHYRAELAAPPGVERVVVRDLLWKCGLGVCVAGSSASRPAVDCSALVRKVGALRSFSVKGQPLAATELEKCNARSR